MEALRTKPKAAARSPDILRTIRMPRPTPAEEFADGVYSSSSMKEGYTLPCTCPTCDKPFVALEMGQIIHCTPCDLYFRAEKRSLAPPAAKNTKTTRKLDNIPKEANVVCWTCAASACGEEPLCHETCAERNLYIFVPPVAP